VSRTRAFAASRFALDSLYRAILPPPSKIDQLRVSPTFHWLPESMKPFVDRVSAAGNPVMPATP
jgi:hypothetical protein